MKRSEKSTSNEHWVIDLICPVGEISSCRPQHSAASTKHNGVPVTCIWTLGRMMATALAWLGVVR